jgi:hypothetical protein
MNKIQRLIATSLLMAGFATAVLGVARATTDPAPTVTGKVKVIDTAVIQGSIAPAAFDLAIAATATVAQPSECGPAAAVHTGTNDVISTTGADNKKGGDATMQSSAVAVVSSSVGRSNNNGHADQTIGTMSATTASVTSIVAVTVADTSLSIGTTANAAKSTASTGNHDPGAGSTDFAVDDLNHPGDSNGHAPGAVAIL